MRWEWQCQPMEARMAHVCLEQSEELEEQCAQQVAEARGRAEGLVHLVNFRRYLTR